MEKNKFIQEKNILTVRGLFIFLLPVHRTVKTFGRYATDEIYLKKNIFLKN